MSDVMLEQILEAWHTNNRINLFLIDKISAEGMKCTLSTRGGRTVVRQFAHMHNNRVWHLERRAKPLHEGLTVFETKEEPPKKSLKQKLKASADRLEEYWRDCVSDDPQYTAFKKGCIAYLSYFVAHESHHRGSILLTLKQCGHKLDQADGYAIWDWNKM